MAMPKRPASHRTESAAVQLFQRWVGEAGWVYRDVPQGTDYGIDGEVEIFENDEATGLLFKVQIRGSAQQSGRISRRVKGAHRTYWRSIGVPVMLVAAQTSTQELFGRWVHRLDEGRYGNEDEPAVVDFDHSHSLHGRQPVVVNEVAQWRGIDSVFVEWPISVHIYSENASLKHHLLMSLRRALNQQDINDILVLATSPENSLGIKVGENFLRVAWPLDAASLTVHAPMEEVVDQASDVLFMCGLLLVGHGYTDQGRELIDASLAGQPVVFESFDFLILLVAQSTEIAMPATLVLPLINVCHSLERNGAEADRQAMLEALDLCLIGLNKIADLLSDFDLEHIVNSLHLSIGYLVDEPDSLARMAHNGAGVLSKAGRYEEARRLIEIAIATPGGGYEKRATAFRMLGDACWNLDDYEGAADAYQVECALDPDDGLARFNYTDSLLHSGDVEGAASELKNLPKLDGLAGDLVEVLPFVLRGLMEGLALSVQARRGPSVLEMLGVSFNRGSAVRSLLKRTDALNPQLWALLRNDGLDLDLLVCRAYFSGMPEHWTDAILAMKIDKVNESAISSAVRLGADASHDFIDTFSEKVCGSESLSDAEIQALELEVALHRRERRRTEINLVGKRNVILPDFNG